MITFTYILVPIVSFPKQKKIGRFDFTAFAGVLVLASESPSMPLRLITILPRKDLKLADFGDANFPKWIDFRMQTPTDL
jgi:hypothetical protein